MDDEVFEAMWREHYEPVARSAYLVLGDREEAADVASEAFARALQGWTTVRELERPQAWVYKVAINAALSHRRRLRRPRMLFARADIPPPEPPRDDLMAAMRSLTPAQRAVVTLRFHLDWSVEDVAAALGKRPGTVQALTHQAMKRLRQDVKETMDD